MLGALAALVPAGPAIAGEATAGGPAAPWQRLPAHGWGAGPAHYPADFRGLAGSAFSPGEGGGGAPWGGVFLGAGDGLRIGALGSRDARSGDLRAIVALELDF
ncbi:MAG: hypothetical protein ACE5EU_13010 [Paracoccaceae bacterium]